jgi:hypothetical protein
MHVLTQPNVLEAEGIRTCTKARFAQMQVWPAFRNRDATAAFAAALRSASGKTMKGAFPPSSIVTRFTESAACFISNLPTRVDPVKAILCTRLLFMRALPIVGLAPDTAFSTPASKHASHSQMYSLQEGCAACHVTCEIVPKQCVLWLQKSALAFPNNSRYH